MSMFVLFCLGANPWSMPCKSWQSRCSSYDPATDTANSQEVEKPVLPSEPSIGWSSGVNKSSL